MIGTIVSKILDIYSFEETAKILDKIKNLGFKYVTKSGFSWGMDDLPDLEEKKKLVAQGDKLVDEVTNQYEMGLLTKDEKHSKIVEIWTSVKDDVTKLSKGCLEEHGPVSTMIISGSRGSWGCRETAPEHAQRGIARSRCERGARCHRRSAGGVDRCRLPRWQRQGVACPAGSGSGPGSRNRHHEALGRPLHHRRRNRSRRGADLERKQFVRSAPCSARYWMFDFGSARPPIDRQ